MTIPDRLRKWLDYKQMSQKELAQKLGTTDSNLSAKLKPDNQILSGFFIQLAELFDDLNLHWLLTNTGTMVLNEDLIKINQDYAEVSSRLNKLEVEIYYLKSMKENQEEVTRLQKEMIGDLKKRLDECEALRSVQGSIQK